jgi:hypothetical protein
MFFKKTIYHRVYESNVRFFRGLDTANICDFINEKGLAEELSAWHKNRVIEQVKKELKILEGN